MFRRLGVLAGGSSLELVQRVVADDAIDMGRGRGAGGTGRSVAGERKRLRPALPSPGQPARVREGGLAAAGEFDTIAARHARAMRSLYESSCDSLIRSGTPAVAAFATMDADLDNAQAALQWAPNARRADGSIAHDGHRQPPGADRRGNGRSAAPDSG